jgi:transposase-like protein
VAWRDSTVSDGQKWVPYRHEEWLRWQHDHLDNSMSEMARVAEVAQATIYRWMHRFGIEPDGTDSGDA